MNPRTPLHGKPTTRRMVITDLDGTLANAGAISKNSLRSLEELGEGGVLRAIATGRSLAGTRKVLGPDFPIDYLIFSSGAGIMDWQRNEILKVHHLELSEIQNVLEVLQNRNLGFMLHHPIPENHRFLYCDGPNPAEDFIRRKEKHTELCQPWNGSIPKVASQFLVVCSPEAGGGLRTELKNDLPNFNVIRATSPLDGKSTWLEIFSRHVSKSQAASWLTQKLHIDVNEVLAVGNDYNDEDLLGWAGTSYIVADATASLQNKFAKVGPCADGGFCEAIARWATHPPAK